MTEPTQPQPGAPPDATPPPAGYSPPQVYPPQAYPPPGYPPLPPGYPPYAMYRAAPPFNTYAILSIIFAVAILPPLGIYFGKKAKQEIERTGERGIELANAAVVVGWIFSAVMGVFLIIWCGFVVTFFTGFFGILGSVNTSP